MATITVYPDPHTETSTVDGHVGIDAGSSGFSATRSAASGNVTSDADTKFGVFCSKAGANFDMRRAIVLFDTSSIPDTDTIDSATFSVVRDSEYLYNTDSGSLAVIGCTPASNTSLAVGDYSAGMTLNSPTEYATRKNWADITADSYTDFTLNANGLAAISKTGITKFMLREGARDIDNAEPTGYNYSIWRSADYTGTSSDPKLVVNYSAAVVTFTPKTVFIN